MEKLKKKRPESGSGEGVSDKKKKTKEESGADGGSVKPDEAEVEEFFAILKRIQVVVKYFEKGTNSGVRKPKIPQAPVGSSPWCPAFELEDFKQVDAVDVKASRQEAGRKNDVVKGAFDLNADPETDHESD